MEIDTLYSKRVNELLEENASIWANLGTGSKYDLGTEEAAEARWQKILGEIKTIDGELWSSLIIEENAGGEWDTPDFIDESLLKKEIVAGDVCSMDDECLSCGS